MGSQIKRKGEVSALPFLFSRSRPDRPNSYVLGIPGLKLTAERNRMPAHLILRLNLKTPDLPASIAITWLVRHIDPSRSPTM